MTKINQFSYKGEKERGEGKIGRPLIMVENISKQGGAHNVVVELQRN